MTTHLFNLTCSCCRGPNDRPTQRYCRQCFAAYMRAYRAKHSKSASFTDTHETGSLTMADLLRKHGEAA